MDILRKHGSKAAIGLAAAGLLCLIFAFFPLPQTPKALLRVEGENFPIEIVPDSLIAGNWAAQAGIRLFPGDRLIYSGVEIMPSFELPWENARELTVKPAVEVGLTLDGTALSYYSSADTLGESLWENGIYLKEGDELSLPADSPLNTPLEVELKTGKPFRILMDEVEIQGFSAARTVGGILAQAGIALQGQDFTRPGESEGVPADGVIEVIRASEESILETSEIPFATERIADPEMAVGEEKVLQTGQNGLRVASVLVRYENGEEASRETGQEWISKQPVSQKTAYGTRVEIQTSPEGLEIWLTKEVRVLSYKDTGSPTASGIWPYYGVIAVPPEWYSILKGTNIFVPGYGVGTVLDVCPGCSGKGWIDVFIPTADYVPWSRNEIISFLAPVPAGFSGDLP